MPTTLQDDQYVWIGGVTGDWGTASNWQDVTTGANPASVAPGSNDAVTIGAASGVVDVITGTGNSLSLTLSGSLDLAGQFATGNLTLQRPSGSSPAPTLILKANDTLSVSGNVSTDSGATLNLSGGALTVGGNFSYSYNGSANINGGTLSIAGNLTTYQTPFSVSGGGMLSVSGDITDSYYYSNYTINGSTFTVGGTLTSRETTISATNTGHVQLANLAEGAIGNSFSVSLTADSTSSIEIGAAGGAAAGTVTIDAGITVAEDGYFNASSIVVNGTLSTAPPQLTGTGVYSAFLSIATTGSGPGLTGSGQVQIGKNGTVTIGRVDPGSANTVAFTGTSGILNISAASLDTSEAFIPTISGFGSSDAIDYAGTVTAATYASGTLTLTNGSTTVATLNLSGDYSGDSFLAVPVNSSTTEIVITGPGDTTTPPAGTSTSDQYIWANAIAGSWDSASNWQDVTTGANPASVAPGSNDAVTIGAASGVVDVITGTGNSLSLTLSGSLDLAGQFATGNLTLQRPSGSSPAPTLILKANDTLSVSGNVSTDSGATLNLSGGALTVGGNFSYSYNGSANINGGTLSIAGNLTTYQTPFSVSGGGMLSVSGDITDSYYYSNYTINGSTFTVGGTLTSRETTISATNTGHVQLANLAEGAIGNSFSVSLTADSTSSIEIGAAGGAAAGTVTIDAGITVAEDGYFNASSIVVNGTLSTAPPQLTGTGVYSAFLSIATTGSGPGLTGSGQVQIGKNGTVTIGRVDPGSANTVAFTGTSGILNISAASLDTSEAFIPTISGFGSSDAIDYAGTVTAATYASGTLTLTNGSTTVATLNLSGDYSGDSFVATPISSSTTQISSVAVCFCRGTLILTERGEVPVEALAVGDRVRTLSGALKPIVWIGFGRDLVTRANRLARPVIVRQGALADNVPRRDLYLTHGHALYFAAPSLALPRDPRIKSGEGREGWGSDGVLIPVEHLVNHRSILWDDTARVVEDYHIELAEHDVVFAEGAPAESYYDAENRALFHNTRSGSEAGAARPAFAPVLNGGDIVGRVWADLYERAGGSIERDASDDPDLHLVIDGGRLGPASVADGAYTFALDAPPAGRLRLCSRSGVPSLIGISRHDHRRLGVAIRQIILSQPGVMTCFAHDAPLFREGGCHLAEDGYCWTDGELVLPAALFGHLKGGFALIVQTRKQAMRYPVSAAAAQAA